MANGYWLWASFSPQAKDCGQLENKWLMINIQNVQDFACQCLNRDVWSNEAVKNLIREHFIFWQVHSHRHKCPLSSHRLFVRKHLNVNCWIVWVWAIVVFRCTTTARKGRDTFSFTSLTSSPIFLFWTPVQVRDMQSPFNVYVYMHRSDRATADFVQWQRVIE